MSNFNCAHISQSQKHKKNGKKTKNIAKTKPQRNMIKKNCTHNGMNKIRNPHVDEETYL